MLPLSDQSWAKYRAASGFEFDAPATLGRMMQDGFTEQVSQDCWNDIVYQGDIGEVAYACLPYFVEFVRQSAALNWEPLALIAAIELARPDGPKMPAELHSDYFAAIQALPKILVQHNQTSWDESIMRSAAACIALAKGQPELARIYFELSLVDGQEWLASRDV